MTVSLRADVSGASGALQLNGVDRLLLNSDGTLSASVSPPQSASSKQVATMENLAASGQVTKTLITASGTYVPPFGVRALKFIAVGGGGGGGGIDGAGAGTAARSGAGGGAGWTSKLTNVIDSSYTVTIGAGGVGGAAGNNNGTDGGTTTVVDGADGTHVNITAFGGNGGGGDIGNSSTGMIGGAAGGSWSGGDYGAAGGDATNRGRITGVVSAASHSGACGFFGGGQRSQEGSSGDPAINYGEGGGAAHGAGVTNDYAGGAGFQGIVIVEEHY